jgi:transcriptional regulator with XRE-family HTH domain
MADQDPLEGLGKALARLRKGAGFATQTEASQVVKIDKGQLSRWEHDHPRPTLENLGRLLAGYGATMMDLALAMEEGAAAERARAVDRGPSDEELIRALTDAIRRVEGRQEATESRVEATASRVERLELDLNRKAR